MPGMMAAEGSAVVGALPAVCVGHTVALVEGTVATEMPAALPLVGVVTDHVGAGTMVAVARVVLGVGSSGGVQIPLRV